MHCKKNSLVSSQATIVLQTFWEDVRGEMVDEKGLAPESADLIGEYVRLSGKSTRRSKAPFTHTR